ncbi:radical SAM protein [Candidatus Sumerlaeota bacterium]|nr:radical SAM protein [Candidatus Sumerlaeota bacterium]
MTVVYPLGKNIYLNVTNRCQTGCVFCIRYLDDYHLADLNLRLGREPTVSDILDEFENVARAHPTYEEIVFCGMGEPLMRLHEVIAICDALRVHERPIRVDTNGLVNLWLGRDVTPELAQVVDSLSISLNAGNARDYAQVCPSVWGEKAFPALLDFIRLAKKRFRGVRVTAVHPNAYERLGKSCPIDLDECRRVAESLGVPFHVRGI